VKAALVERRQEHVTHTIVGMWEGGRVGRRVMCTEEQPPSWLVVMMLLSSADTLHVRASD